MRKFLILPAVLFLTACGFQPVYAPTAFESGSAQNVSLAQVAVRPLPERFGQQIRNSLLDRGFTDTDTTAYMVDLANLQLSEFDMGVSPDNTATRRMMTASAGLVILKNGQEIARRPLVARSTYNVLVSQYGTIVANDSATRQIVNDLAKQIETQTMLVIGQQKP